MPTTAKQSTTLYYRSGSSDKVYHVRIDACGEGFAVNFAFGRRGSTLQTGAKTAAAVGLAEAQKIYDALVKEKTAKGYTPGEDGTPYQQTDKADRATGVVPQLLNAIESTEAEKLLCDAAWLAQEKFDGKRVLIARDGQKVTGINRTGLSIALPQPVVEQAKNIAPGQWLMDGECMGDIFVCFDLLERERVALRAEPYRKRLDALSLMVKDRSDAAIRLVRTASTTADKRNMLELLQRQSREGIVFKRADAIFTPGRPASGGDQRKYKFTASASCIVCGVNAGKRSVKLELIDGKARISVGNVTVPVNQAIPSKGDIIEVRYLYAYPGGALYQPVYLGAREDIAEKACMVAQLKFKSGETEDA